MVKTLERGLGPRPGDSTSDSTPSNSDCGTIHYQVIVTVEQEHYVLACLEKCCLALCNGVDKPITFRFSVRDQPESVDLEDQELFRCMVGTFYILRHVPDQILHFWFLSSLVFKFVSNPQNSILKQPSMCSAISKRLSTCDSSISRLLHHLTIPRFRPTCYGAMLTLIGHICLFYGSGSDVSPQVLEQPRFSSDCTDSCVC
jgi:hypothetical protein